MFLLNLKYPHIFIVALMILTLFSSCATAHIHKNGYKQTTRYKFRSSHKKPSVNKTAEVKMDNIQLALQIRNSIDFTSLKHENKKQEHLKYIDVKPSEASTNNTFITETDRSENSILLVNHSKVDTTEPNPNKKAWRLLMIAVVSASLGALIGIELFITLGIILFCYSMVLFARNINFSIKPGMPILFGLLGMGLAVGLFILGISMLSEVLLIISVIVALISIALLITAWTREKE